MVFLALLGGCAVGPNYKRPAVNTPENFRFAESRGTNSVADLPWWQVFQDPRLQDLVRTALTNNYDLKQAVARVEQSRNLAIAARGGFFPQIGYSGNVGRGRNALYNSLATLKGNTESSAMASLNAFWEIDFWGRIRRLSQAARAQYLATDEARCGVTITLLPGPLFQGGQLRAQYRVSKAQYHEAAAAYQQTVLTAFADVSDALISRQKLAEENVFNGQAVVALTSSVELATERYLNGKSSYYEVLQAQQELYPAQRAQVQTQAGELIAVVQLYKALGGGWPAASEMKQKK